MTASSLTKANLHYWNSYKGQQRFTSPLADERFTRHLSANDRVLDLGCGYGRVAAYLYGRGIKNVFGIDPSQELIEEAKRSFPATTYPELRFRVGVVDDIPRTEHFEAALLFAVIEYVYGRKDREHFVAAIHDRLNPQGLVLLEAFVQDWENNAALYEKAMEAGKEKGTILLPNGLSVYHDTPEGLDTLFSQGYEKLESNQELFQTWSGRQTRGYYAVYRKKGS